MTDKQTDSVEAALAYLKLRNALHKLAIAVPVLGTNVCIYHPKVCQP